MADLAFGISKAAVQFLADKVKNALKEEAEQWQTVQRDLVFITGEFEMMQSFLNTANAERVNNHVVRTWVRQVRDLSYDVEDCIEFVLHLDTKRSWWLRLRPSCSCSMDGAARPVDEAVTEIKQLKARVEDVSQRNIRYSLISDSGSKPLIQNQQWVFDSSIGAPAPHIISEARETAMKYGFLIDLSKLITQENDDLRVISLWEPSDDLQRMSIIGDVYHDPKIYEKIKCRAWVKVMHPFDPKEFIRSSVAQFYTNRQLPQHGPLVKHDLSKMLKMSAGRQIDEFAQQVNTNSYLIILEDLSTMVQWDAITPYLPDMKNGSCIIVSTRHHEMASLCTGKPYRVMELFSSSQLNRLLPASFSRREFLERNVEEFGGQYHEPEFGAREFYKDYP